jgi:hypothetical protein
MWWLLVVLITVAIVGALVVMRRRESLGSDPSGGDFTSEARNRNTLSDPNTGMGGFQPPGG